MCAAGILKWLMILERLLFLSHSQAVLVRLFLKRVFVPVTLQVQARRW